MIIIINNLNTTNYEAKKQYINTLRKEYFKADKKGKTAILNEYCKRTGEDRKYAIKKFRYKIKTNFKEMFYIKIMRAVSVIIKNK